MGLPNLVVAYAYNDRYGVYLAQGCWADKRFFYITPRIPDTSGLTSFLNSGLVPFLIELGGIVNLGEGAIYTNVYWLEGLQVPRAVSSAKLRRKVKEILAARCKTAVRTVWQDIGLPAPDDDYGNIRADQVSLAKIKPDRRELDKIIMGEILGLTEEEQLEVYRAVVDLVKSRLARAGSVPKNNQKKRRFDPTAFLASPMKSLEFETLGGFYKNRVLSEKDAKVKKLPKLDRKVKIEYLGISDEWFLKTGKAKIQCASEWEARYLKIWIELHAENIRVPQDMEKLAEIVPELEELKRKHEEFVLEITEGLSERDKEAVASRFWQEATQVPEG